MKRIALALAGLATLALTACGNTVHQEVKTIGGVKSICSWSVNNDDFFGHTKHDYICQAIPAGTPATVTP